MRSERGFRPLCRLGLTAVDSRGLGERAAVAWGSQYEAIVRTRDLTNATARDAADSWIGRHVFFRVQDAFLPTPQELMASLFGATVLEGDVVAESRGDAEAQAPQSQLVVSVGRLNQLIVVHRALLFEESPGGGETADKEGRHE